MSQFSSHLVAVFPCQGQHVVPPCLLGCLYLLLCTTQLMSSVETWNLARSISELLNLAMQATASSASQAHSPPPLPLRPFLAKPHPPTCSQPHPSAPSTSHAEATASTSINHSSIPMPASSAAANVSRGATARAKTSNRGDDDATASAKTGKPPVGGQRQVQSRKRGRPPSHASGSQERLGM